MRDMQIRNSDRITKLALQKLTRTQKIWIKRSDHKTIQPKITTIATKTKNPN